MARSRAQLTTEELDGYIVLREECGERSFDPDGRSEVSNLMYLNSGACGSQRGRNYARVTRRNGAERCSCLQPEGKSSFQSHQNSANREKFSGRHVLATGLR